MKEGLALTALSALIALGFLVLAVTNPEGWGWLFALLALLAAVVTGYGIRGLRRMRRRRSDGWRP